MKKVLFVFAALLAFSAFTVAEDHSKFDFYGGWTLTHYAPSALDEGWTAWKGVGFSGCYYFHKNVGFVADFSWTSKHWADGDINQATWYFLGGPQFRFVENDNVTPFFRVLFGWGRVSAALYDGHAWYEGSEDKLAYGVGGGIDVKVSDNVSLRLAQVDYIRQTGDIVQGNVFRFGVGIVFNAR
ncbi:MAG: porin family protein [Acidobacteria bacterium]|nr:porin family protein [Acidobacteriota bacterium]